MKSLAVVTSGHSSRGLGNVKLFLKNDRVVFSVDVRSLGLSGLSLDGGCPLNVCGLLAALGPFQFFFR